MKLTDDEPDPNEEPVDGSGLLSGITAYEIRLLTENPWNGGCGYTYEQVGQMTPDQIWHRLTDRELLKHARGKRTKKMQSGVAGGYIRPEENGMIRGRAKDGSLIKGKIAGKSKARQLMEEATKKRESEKKPRRKRKRNGD